MPWPAAGSPANDDRGLDCPPRTTGPDAVSRSGPHLRGSRKVAMMGLAGLHFALAAALALSAGSGAIDDRLAFMGYGMAVAATLFVMLGPGIRNRNLHSQNHSGAPATLRLSGSPRVDATASFANAAANANSPVPRSVVHLAARMEHDLRTPLNAVIGFSEIISNEVHGPIGNERYRDCAQHIGASGMALLAATQDAITVASLMARPARTAACTSDLHEAVRAAAKVPRSGSRTIVDVCPGSPAVRVRCDLQPLVHAIGRTIQLVCDRTRDADRLTASWTTARGVAVATVRCTSCGAEPGHSGGLAKPIRQRCEEPAPHYPQAEEDLSFCLARALCELQGIDLSLAQLPCGCWQAQLAIETTERQPAPFERRVEAA